MHRFLDKPSKMLFTMTIPETFREFSAPCTAHRGDYTADRKDGSAERGNYPKERRRGVYI